MRSQSSLEPDALLPPPEPDETLFGPPARTPMGRDGPTPAPEFESISLIDVTPEESRDPVPVDAGEAADETGAEGVVVRGVLCKNGHFNNPISAFCSSCGISMVQLTHNPVEGVRPPLLGWAAWQARAFNASNHRCARSRTLSSVRSDDAHDQLAVSFGPSA